MPSNTIKHGFTLIEVLISLTIFSVGMLAVVTVASQAQLLTRTGTVRTRAALLVQEGLESAVAAGYSQLSTTQPFLDEVSLSDLGADYTAFSRTVNVQNVTSAMAVTSADTGMKLVTATVRWTSQAGESSKMDKEFDASTIVTDL